MPESASAEVLWEINLLGFRWRRRWVRRTKVRAPQPVQDVERREIL